MIKINLSQFVALQTVIAQEEWCKEVKALILWNLQCDQDSWRGSI